MRVLPWLSLLLAGTVIYLKVLYGNLHAVAARMLRGETPLDQLVNKLMSTTGQLSTTLMIMSMLVVLVGLVSINQKSCPSFVRVIALLVFIATIVIALVAV